MVIMTRWCKACALGHRVNLAEQSSGLSAITRSEAGWAGGADPRREGAVMGDDA